MEAPGQEGPNKFGILVRLFLLFSWRYFTGAHMDGKVRRHRNGKVMPRYSEYFWNRYSRRKRALIRWIAFWLVYGELYGWRTDWPDTKFATFAVMPFIGARLVKVAVNKLTMPVRATNSDGVQEAYRILRPAVRARITRWKPPKWRLELPEGAPVPSEYARAILAENAVDGGEPIASVRMIDATSVKESSRGRTIRRGYQRKANRT